MTKSAVSSSPTIVDTYLILIPITVTNDGGKVKLTSEYIDRNDLIYIIDLMRQIENEEYDEKVAMVQKINYSSILNNEDMDSSTSIVRFQLHENFLWWTISYRTTSEYLNGLAQVCGKNVSLDNGTVLFSI